MSEEKLVRSVMTQLESGVEVKHKSPHYMNAVVGQGNLGYVISLMDNENTQINVVLKVQNNKALFRCSTITMIVHSIFRYESDGREKKIQTTAIGQEVILAPSSEGCKLITAKYSITGILTLKKKPP